MSANTWGISGPAFLQLFLLLAAVLLVAALRSRHLRRHPPVPAGAPPLDARSDAYLIAYLGGGPNRALLAALGSVWVAGLVRGHNGRCTRVTIPPVARRPALERAVLTEAVVPLTRAELVSRHSVGSALDELRDDLVRRGLLHHASNGRRRRWAFAMAALFLVGLARLVAGVSGGKPVGFLVSAMLLVAALTGVLFRLAASARTARGDTELAELRAAHPHLAPSMKPDWTANGATAATLAVGLFGAGALWAADPDPVDLLDRLPLERVAYLHVAGGAEHDGLYHDTHTAPTPEPVLALLRELSARFAARPLAPAMLLERDGSYPPADQLHAELDAIASAAGLARITPRGAPSDGQVSKTTLASSR
jgi:uncharacterized protein (TIGR04222 family)